MEYFAPPAKSAGGMGSELAWTLMGSAQLPARLAQEAPRDDQHLDLLGALGDVEDLGVARPLLEQLGLAVADRAAELDAPERDLGDDAAGLGLGHRGLGRIGDAVVRH